MQQRAGTKVLAKRVMRSLAENQDVTGLHKMPTGVEGFDAITGGGLPRNRTSLILGGPGGGKTVFALQTLVNGARQFGEPGIFVAFEENSRHILANAASFGWNLPKLEKKQLFFFDAKMGPDVIKGGEFDLSGMLAGIKAEADARGARRIVFDAVDALLSLLDDPLAERREIYRLDDWLSESGLTGIITAKSQGDDPFVGEGYGFMQFMADCVVALKLRVVDQIALRYVQVIKYRGSSFAENEAPLVIGASGMEVADISATTVAPAASQERVSSGVERLDAMLGSGYFRGSSVLITGSAGTGKSILAGTFAEAACLRKERTFYVSFDENPSEVVRRCWKENARAKIAERRWAMIPFGNEQPRRPEEKGPFVFRLYVVDEAPSSARAIANLSAICKNHLPDNHQIEIVDLLQDPRRVLSDKILATPTLIKLSPAPVRKIIGDLDEEAKVLLALGLQQRTT